MPYNCEVVDQPTCPTLSVRTRTSVAELQRMLGGAYQAVMEHLAVMREQPAGPPFAVYYNMDMENLDVEAGFPVGKVLPGRGEVLASELPSGPSATCTHVGTYQTLAEAYSTLTQWVAERGYEPTGITYEVYLSDPNETPPDQLQTKIVFPLRAK